MENPTFNLWTEPWITLERLDGTLEQQSIEYTLLNAQDYRGFYEQSPLVVVGIHRLLAGILQDALKPDELPKLKGLWEQPKFPADEIRNFGLQYAHRFDLFSAYTPFFQSSDIPIELTRTGKIKREDEIKITSVANLMPEIPSGTFVLHYAHQLANNHVFCPSCVGKGLAIVPSFTTSGGPGKWKSINGAPPIYTLPVGTTLFESLRASLVTREFRPDKHLAPEQDLAWWKRSSVVRRCKNPGKDGKPVPEQNQHLQLATVGYLHGLTFMPRRIRLKVIPMKIPCTRCGQINKWGVQEIVFDAGEHAIGSMLWQDPFVSYRPSKKEGGNPYPITPKENIALWREYVGLFLPDKNDLAAGVWRQILRVTKGDVDEYAFRCVGAFTDEMLFNEWFDAEMRVPLRLLLDPARGEQVRSGFAFAENCSYQLIKHFKRIFVPARESKGKKVNEGLAKQMQTLYWSALAEKFLGDFVQKMTVDEWQADYQAWVDFVLRQAYHAFEQACEIASLKGTTASKRAEALSACRIDLFKARKKHLVEKGIEQ